MAVQRAVVAGKQRVGQVVNSPGSSHSKVAVTVTWTQSVGVNGFLAVIRRRRFADAVKWVLYNIIPDESGTTGV
jgi:hypothetical protein